MLIHVLDILALAVMYLPSVSSVLSLVHLITFLWSNAFDDATYFDFWKQTVLTLKSSMLSV